MSHLVTNANDSTGLPIGLQRQIANELETNKNELAVWQLAGDGWRGVVGARLAAITERRNRKLNSPKTNNTHDLFDEAVGFPGIPSAWSWKGMNAMQAQKKLDTYIELRGAVAHRSKASASIYKGDAEDFVAHVERLVEATDARVNVELDKACGKPLF